MEKTFFPVKVKIRIDWSDLDYFGHVNNISIFKYFQTSRVKYLGRIGLFRLFRETNTGPILASSKGNFRQPLFFPGHITVQSRVGFIRNTSFGIFHEIIDDKGHISAEGQDVIVVFDFDKNKKVAVPQKVRSLIERLEGKSF